MFTQFLLLSSLLNLAVNASPALYKREVGPLFGPSGLPSVDDVQQHHLDCAYVASVITLTDRAPLYVKSLLQFEGDFNAVSEVTATCWTYKDKDKAEIRKPKIGLADTRHRNNTKGDIWWPGALYQAPIHEGIAIDPRGEGGMPTLQIEDAMKILTGKEAEHQEPKTLKEFWDFAVKVKDSPMVLATKNEGCKTLWGKHGYAFVGTEGDTPETGMINLINTNGKREHLPAEKVFQDTYYFVNWIGYPSFIDERAP